MQPPTPDQIRAHIRRLRKVRNLPCDCKGEHLLGCFVGGRMMDASIEVLLWVLGEGDYHEMVDRIAKDPRSR